MNSGKVAGINPYDGKSMDEFIFIVDNILSMLLN